MLNKIKKLLGIPDDSKNDLLELFIELCSDEYKSLTHTDNIDEIIVQQMVLYRYQTRGTYGITREGYNGMTFMYTSDYPADLYKLIISKRMVQLPK